MRRQKTERQKKGRLREEREGEERWRGQRPIETGSRKTEIDSQGNRIRDWTDSDQDRDRDKRDKTRESSDKETGREAEQNETVMESKREDRLLYFYHSIAFSTLGFQETTIPL